MFTAFVKLGSPAVQASWIACMEIRGVRNRAGVETARSQSRSTNLQQYEASHRQVPARLVIHKTSKFNQQEIEGCEEAVKEFRIHDLDLLSLAPSFVRLFRDGDYPPLRGTIIDADETQSFLYTRGSIVYYEEYPGMYVPKTLQVRFDKIISDKRLLLEEILALTKMNWNNTQIDSLTPITIKAARQVGDILRYVKSTDSIQARYSYFM